jgi:lipopolysaccharide/colanic/teichoic acid biosynthesis glycosyltransferase
VPRTVAIKHRNTPAVTQRFWHRDQIRRNGDIAIACALIVFTLPLMAIVALAIKCESAGPVFERQARVGFGGRRYVLLRFRTIVQHSDDVGAHCGGSTRVGRFLRYLRIDELPKLINVLRGDIDLGDFRD